MSITSGNHCDMEEITISGPMQREETPRRPGGRGAPRLSDILDNLVGDDQWLSVVLAGTAQELREAVDQSVMPTEIRLTNDITFDDSDEYYEQTHYGDARYFETGLAIPPGKTIRLTSDDGGPFSLSGGGNRRVTFVDAVGSLYLKNIILENGLSDIGGGAVVISHATLVMQEDSVIRRSEVINSQDSQLGGGAALTHADTDAQSRIIMMDNALIEDCRASIEGGAIDLQPNAMLAIIGRAQIRRCESGSGGGGVFSSGEYPSPKITMANEASVSECKSASGGAIYLMAGSILAFEDAADIQFKLNDAESGDGGAIYTETTPNANLFIPSNVRFIDNHASRGCDEPSASVKAVEAICISDSAAFTAPYEFAYNNYDINIDEADCLREPPIPAEDTVRIVAQAKMCASCREITEGMFTAVLSDAQGDVIAEASNDARGKFAIDLDYPKETGVYLYTMALKRTEIDGLRLNRMRFKIYVHVDAQAQTVKVKYIGGSPLFLCFCKDKA